MNREEATALVNSAIDRLLQHDYALLDLDVTERSLSYRLAHYMALSEAIRAPLTAVSYTHLDVYKRQAVDQTKAWRGLRHESGCCS